MCVLVVLTCLEHLAIGLNPRLSLDCCQKKKQKIRTLTWLLLVTFYIGRPDRISLKVFMLYWSTLEWYYCTHECRFWPAADWGTLVSNSVVWQGGWFKLMFVVRKTIPDNLKIRKQFNVSIVRWICWSTDARTAKYWFYNVRRVIS